MPNLSKIQDPRFWERWRSAGAVSRPFAEETFDEATRQRIIAEQVVDIIGCGLYVKTRWALPALSQQLKADGYEIKDCGKDKHHPAPGSHYASLRENVCDRKGKCGSCGSYISTLGIQMHKHKCEVCGAYTYVKYCDGAIVRFTFINNERNAFEPSLKMKVYDYDDSIKCLLLYPVPEDGNNFNDWGVDNAMKVLERNKDKFTHVERDGRDFLAIHYNAYTVYVQPDDVISMCDTQGHQWNHKIVKLYKGKEYSEWDRLPIPESYMIYEAWRWAPLNASPTLHESILHAAGMVTDCGYYHQDGQREFYDLQLNRMRLFVQNFTTLDLAAWDRMIQRADKSGPGMIKAVARFCHSNPHIENKPNIGNLLTGVCKINSGERITEDEIAAIADATKDPQIMSDFAGLMEPRVPA
jgi:hypothetical protein